MLSWIHFVFLLSHLSGPCYLQSDFQGLLSDDKTSDYSSLVSHDFNVSMPPPWPGEGSPLPLHHYHGDIPGDTDHATAPSPQSELFSEAEFSRDNPFAVNDPDLATDRTNSEPSPQRSGRSSKENDRSVVLGTEVPLSSAQFDYEWYEGSEWYPYAWNKTKQSAWEFLLAFCPRGCSFDDDAGGNFTIRTNVVTESNPNLNRQKVEVKVFNGICFSCECKNSGKHDLVGGFPAVAEELSSIYPDRTLKERNQFCGIGNCCPTGQEVEDASFAKAGEHAGCLAQPGNKAYVIMGCPSDTVNQSLRDACENGQGEFTVDEPVTDRDTKVTYRNQDCARCHGVRSFQPWPISVSCKHFQYLYRARSEVELLRLIRGNQDDGTTSVCSVNHEPPPDVPMVKCSDHRFYVHRGYDTVLTSPQQYNDSMTHGTIIAACNVTGLWADFDPDVQAGCGEFTGLSFRVVVRESLQMYTNLFCAMCNGFQPEWQYNVGFSSVIPGDPSPPLAFLLGLQDRGEDIVHAGHKTCVGGQWFAFDNECRNVSCPAGKSLNETSGTCTTAVKMIRGLVYQLDIILVPKQSVRLTVPATNQSVVVSMLNKALVQTFDYKTSGLLVRYGLTFVLYTQSVVTRTAPDVYTVQHEVDRVRVSANITSTSSKERDEVEEALVGNLLLQDWALLIAMTGETVNFTPSSVHHDLFGIRYNVSKGFIPVYFHFDMLSFQSFSSYVYIPPKHRIQLTRLLTCPSVEFGPTELLIKPEEDAEDHVNKTQSKGQEQDSSTTSLPPVIKEETIPETGVLKKVAGQWMVALMGREISLLHSQFSWEIRQDGGFVVCLDTLEELLARHRRRKTGAFSWQYALSMAAIPLSILCLLVLLVVYALLPEMRTQPGLNTMGACTTLLLAQLSLLLASHRVVSGAWCTALGVFVHLSWLSTFCWTSVCSVHMYRAFSCKTDRRCGRVSYKVLAQSGAVTLLLPGAVVAVVVAVSWQQSGGRSIGYSSATCYLRSPLVVGLSVLLPLSVILAFNLLFYSLTVYRIHKVTTLQARAQSETVSGAQHVRACLRLSLLTGVTWLFSLLSESMDLDWLRAVSILANGGQGVLLLLSYVTTKRVTDMLMTRMGCGDDVTRGSSTVTEGLTERSNVGVRRSHASNADV
ncbi:uncharacterized protein [Littorina saxatilis]|uniref:uncharacterized protein n=1 Tax=Littorina saxatilis TaxID=31220 RepID=UPI0038B6B1E6